MKRRAEERRQWCARIFRVMRDSEEFVGNAPLAIVPDFTHADACLFVAFGWGENITDR
jgi:hypothetical protein